MSGTAKDDLPTEFGSSTEQHITGAEETGEFITDREPTSGTQSHGSSNAGINDNDGNRATEDDDQDS